MVLSVDVDMLVEVLCVDVCLLEGGLVDMPETVFREDVEVPWLELALLVEVFRGEDLLVDDFLLVFLVMVLVGGLTVVRDWLVVDELVTARRASFKSSFTIGSKQCRP